MSDIKVGIIADDKTSKGIKSAQKNVSSLDKTIGKLAKNFTALFAADKIIAFGKASLKAFEEDQKSAALLANTMKNLGMEFASPVLEGYISNLSKTAAVADDELRPAMQKLLTQTGDYFKSQEILNQAIEVSRGSGVELATVTQDLAAAYVGNTKGLKKYNLGLTQAELKTMKFTDIQKKLTAQFKGSNAAYLKTYAGQMEVLKVAAGEAQETIGKGLVDSLSLIAGNGSVQSLADAMQSFADFTSNAIYGLGSLISKLKGLKDATPGWLSGLALQVPLGPASKALSILSKYGEKEINKTLENPSTLMFKKDEANNRLNNEQFKKQQKLAADQLKATKALTAEQKKQALLKKQSTLFDLEQIQLVAALKGKLSDEERDRVKLQLALLQGNEEEAARLSAKIADTIDKTGQLKRYLSDLTFTNDPFKNWMDSLEKIAAKAASISSMAAGTGATSTAPSGTADYGGNIIGSLVPNFTPTTQYNTGGAATTVNVQVDGKTIASALLDQSLSGNQAYVDRRTGGFNW